MELAVSTTQEKEGVFIISPDGSIDSDTDSILDDEIAKVLENSPKAIVLELKSLNYISSSGIRVILKAKKALKKSGGSLLFMNMQPQIRKVFDIIKALPSMNVFTTVEELDRYLDKMQKKVLNERK